MDTLNYKSLPELKLLLNHIHKINTEYGINIIFPNKKWPGLKLNQPPEAMNIIIRHYKVFLKASGNDFGLDFFIQASTSADLWIHILDENQNIIGLSTNEKHYVKNKSVNYFRITFFDKSIQGLGIYSLLQKLRFAIFPSDYIIARTQHPIVYKTFKKLCNHHGMSISPTVNSFYSKSINIAKGIGLNINDQSVIPGGIRGEVLTKTPAPSQDLASLWKRINLKNGDLLVMVGYK